MERSERGNARERRLHNSSKTVKSSSDDESRTQAKSDFKRRQGDYDEHVFWGLNLAGVASSCLTTIFGIFHVQVFLQAYKLPLATYTHGNAIYAVINTANDVAGAWIVDQVATKRSRVDFVGLSGCCFALCFLAPFFRWPGQSSWDVAHFVTSLSLYDTLYAFTCILMGSVVTDNHHMTDKARVRFMASGKIVNLCISFVVARIGLSLFDVTNLHAFREFILVLVAVVCVMFWLAQRMISGRFWTFDWRRFRIHPVVIDNSYQAVQSQHTKEGLRWRQVVEDFWNHSNFRAWIGMEMLLEGQLTFLGSFTKTFVDQLVVDSGYSRETCDWFLSILRPVKSIAGILIYAPIRQIGYTRLYTFMFAVNFLLAGLMYIFTDFTSTTLIVAFLTVYSILTGAVQSSGFHLAMSDMVTEMKLDHARQGRYDVSFAAMFMGVNALFCKPMESFLPIVAGNLLQDEGDSKHDLFLLLVLPPLAFSLFQLFVWSYFDLTPKRMKVIRQELDQMVNERDTDKDAGTDILV